MDHTRMFAQAPLQIPLYSHGCLQRAVGNAKQILSTQNDDRCAFSIDSILARNCSRDTDPSESISSRMAMNSGERFLPRQTAAVHHARFHPYFSLPRTSLGQTNAFAKTSPKKEHEGKVTEQDGWTLDKPKRMRTIFTVEQLERMEMEFDRQQYMVGADRFFLANELGLTETQVKVWFQNRRIKWRKNILEKQHRQLSGKGEEQ